MTEELQQYYSALNLIQSDYEDALDRKFHTDALRKKYNHLFMDGIIQD